MVAEHPLKRRATRRARQGSIRRQSSKQSHKRQASVKSGSHSISSCPGAGTTPRRPNGQPSRLDRKLMLDNLDADTPKTDITASGNGNKAAGQRVDLESGGGEVFSAKPVQKTVKEHVLGLFCSGMCF